MWPGPPHELWERLDARIQACARRIETRAVDGWRRPKPIGRRTRRFLATHVLRLLSPIGLTPRILRGGGGPEALAAYAAGLPATYELLADASSRTWLVELLAFRVLGPRRVRLPRNNPAYWALRGTLEDRYRVERLSGPRSTWPRDRFRIPVGDEVVEYVGHKLTVLDTFLLEQYARDVEGAVAVRAARGDIVVDAGACAGDTALYFAACVGPEGRVCSIEFEPANLGALRRNLERNKALAARISVVEQALWDAAGLELAYAAAGAGTRLDPACLGGTTASTTTLDTLLGDGQIPRVDFLKMDIEGAELAALRGAEQVLRRDRPKLALSLYHRPEDLVSIPAYLAGLDLGYRFYLDHFTIHREETVLFACVP